MNGIIHTLPRPSQQGLLRSRGITRLFFTNEQTEGVVYEQRTKRKEGWFSSPQLLIFAYYFSFKELLKFFDSSLNK